jgi:NhaP-type Na+/H+ or K+/H+ antiporter
MVADSNLLNRDTIVMTAVCGVTLSIIFHGISANPLIALLVKKEKKQV